MDGVLVDSREHHLSAWHEWARELDLTPGADYFTHTFGLRNDAIITPLIPEITHAELRRLAERKETLFRERARGQLVLLPGVRGLLDVLSAQSVPTAVVTSAPRLNLDMILDTLRLSGTFTALVAEEDAAKGKPDPQGFLVAARRVGVAPERCVVIEDAPAGLRAAKAGGMRAIGVTTTHAAPALFDADLVVDSVGEDAVQTFIFA